MAKSVGSNPTYFDPSLPQHTLLKSCDNWEIPLTLLKEASRVMELVVGGQGRVEWRSLDISGLDVDGIWELLVMQVVKVCN